MSVAPIKLKTKAHEICILSLYQGRQTGLIKADNSKSPKVSNKYVSAVIFSFLGITLHCMIVNSERGNIFDLQLTLIPYNHHGGNGTVAVNIINTVNCCKLPRLVDTDWLLRYPSFYNS